MDKNNLYQSKTKILIAGIGGVGGYFGGLLAKKYENHDGIDIYFLSRGAHLDAIRNEGLEVKSGEEIFTTRPKLATDKAEEIGKVELIFIATKGYDLDEIIQQISPCVGSNTLIIPLLNGVNNRAKIKSLLATDARVLEGCVYMVSRFKEPGKIVNSGGIQSLHFGLDDGYDARLEIFEIILTDAGIDARYERNILTVIWEKYVFLSSAAAVTTYYDLNVGKICEDEAKLDTLRSLAGEAIELARKKGIELSENIFDKTISNFRFMPSEGTTSMHSDFRKNRQKTEVESLIGYVVREGEKLNVQIPTFTKVYASLKAACAN